jgi:aspartyl-tRNA(Asn)/glutamyl-tRNA(Gln) amidotransferase subunit A
MSELLTLTLTELLETLRSRRASALELMQTVLARMEATGPRLNALADRRDPEPLLADARAADERYARGAARPLEGIPLGVKDLEDVEGLVTSHGSLPFRDNVARRDSTQVSRLRAAGAIVVAKTTAPEFGYTAITKNLIHGVTRSPWDPERTPGGSSGGSAALLAGEVLPLVTGSDGGGSIRIPASFVGCFGLKTSYGRIPKGPSEFWDTGRTAVLGPITKTVGDAALFLDQVVGHDSRDPSSLPHPGVSYVRALNEPFERPLRIAYSRDLGYAVVQSDVAAVVDRAVQAFEELGHRVTPIEGGPPELGAHWGITGAWELGSHVAHLLDSRRGEFMKSLIDGIDMARGITLEWWAETARKRAELVEWCARLFAEHDLLVTPTVPYDPPPARGPFPSETEGRLQRVAGVAAFTIPFNLSWHPAATVRAGSSRIGLPVGLQIVGPLQRDDLVLRAARAFERARPWHPHWPMRSA